MDLLQLRQLVQTELGDQDLLGYYQLPNKQTLPAVCVLPDKNHGFNYPPDGYKAFGIEVAIVKNEDDFRQNFGKDLQMIEKTKIYLKQWDSNKHGDLLRARQLVVKLLNWHGYLLEKTVTTAASNDKKILATSLIEVKEIAIYHED